MTYRILAIGDSVVWGQGLAEKSKFVKLVEDHVRTRLRLGRSGIWSVNLAHSGADIEHQAKTWPASRSARFQAAHLYGEVPKELPNIHTQVMMAKFGPSGKYGPYFAPLEYDIRIQRTIKQLASRKCSEFRRNDPNLIIVDGGINDTNARNIVLPIPFDETGAAEKLNRERSWLARINPFTDRAEYEAMIRAGCYLRMRKLLKRIRGVFRGAPIIVTGYYPLFTEGRLDIPLDALIGSAFIRFAPDLSPFVIGEPAFQRAVRNYRIAWGRGCLTKRSARWYSESTRMLSKAVNEVDRGEGMIHLAVPRFGPNNGAGGRESYLYSNARDPVNGARKRAFDAWRDARGPWSGWKIDKQTAYSAAMFHPNRLGAQAYARAITRVIDVHSDLFLRRP